MFSQKAVPIWLPADKSVTEVFVLMCVRSAAAEAYPVRLSMSAIISLCPGSSLPETLMISLPMVSVVCGVAGRMDGRSGRRGVGRKKWVGVVLLLLLRSSHCVRSTIRAARLKRAQGAR